MYSTTYLENKDLGLANERGAVDAIEVPTVGAKGESVE